MKEQVNHQVVEPPCQDCPLAMNKFCGNLLDSRYLAGLEASNRGEFAFDMEENRGQNKRSILLCRTKNVPCPMDKEYLDWVMDVADGVPPFKSECE